MGGLFFDRMAERKRVLLFALVGILSFYLGYFAFDDKAALHWFRHVGYWLVAGMTAGLVWLIYSGYRRKGGTMWAYLKSRAGLTGLLAVLLGSIFLFRAETVGFKTVMDDHVLAGTAKTFHESREAFVPTRTIVISGRPMSQMGFVDKRPILQPFLVSLVHDLTGYRPLNGPYLNVVLTPFLLFMLYVLAERLGGVKTGVGAVALFCSLPLLSYMCAGGGMETLNVFFILLTCLLAVGYLQAPDASRLGALVLSGILLAQCRYESILFVVPVGLVVIWSWVKERRLLVPWVLILCPLLLVPWLWQNRIFRVAEKSWQMEDYGEGMQPFGLHYMYDNFGRAVGYLFDLHVASSNSWLLTGLGVVALLLFAVAGMRRWREFSSQSAAFQAQLLFLPGFILLFFLLLGYGWEFDSPVIQRLSLPLHIPLAVVGAYLVFGYLHCRVLHRVAAIVLVVYFLGYAYPATSQRVYAKTYQSPYVFELAGKFLREHEGERMVIIAEDSPFFSLYNDFTLSTSLANERKEQIKFFIQQPNSPPVYWFRRQIYDPTTKTFVIGSRVSLDEDFVYEPVWEESFSELRRVGFVRIVDVKGVEAEEPEFKSMLEYIKYWASRLP